MLAKTLEDCIINGYNNYLLDPRCPIEPFPVYLNWLVQELLDSGENMRTNKVYSLGYHRTQRRRALKRPRPGSDEALAIGMSCRGGKDIGSIKELLASDRTKHCAFCSRSKAKYKCRSCNAHLCMQTPKTTNGIRFLRNGPCCYLRFHGYSKFPV